MDADQQAGRSQSLEPLLRFLGATAPFHIAFDRSLRVTQTGRSIRRLCPLAAGQRLDEHLALAHPAGAITIDTLRKRVGSVVVFTALARHATLRGELAELPGAGQLCFLGAPQVSDAGELERLGLAPADLAVSDPILDRIGSPHSRASGRDATRRAPAPREHELEQAAYGTGQELAAQLDSLFDLVLRVNRRGRIGEVRGPLAITISDPPEALIGLHAGQAVPELGRRLGPAIELAFAGERAEPFTFDAVSAGMTCHFEARVVPWSADQAFVLVRDVTKQRQLELLLARQAFEDRLTGLGNRTLFYTRAQQALGRCECPRLVAALLIDIDDMRLTNDGLGHKYGDELLTAMAKRLAGCVRPGDTVARLGGDEFAVLLEGAGTPTARAIAKRIVRTLSTPIRLLEHELPVTVSVGIAVADPQDGVDELLRKADVAMYRAKAAGKCRFANYRAAHDIGPNRIEVEAELRRALDNDELCVWYQPIVALKTRSLIGFEALVRWEHPTRGMVTPAEFIPVAEQSNLIIQIGERVLGSACRQASEWQRSAGAADPPTVSVNVSSRQLTDRALVRNVERALSETGLDPGLLVLEITETALLSGQEHALETLDRLNQIGLAIALDDFGTGYSSLSRLQQFPVGAIKIDKSFVDGITEGGQAAAFARVVIQLAAIVGVQSVAEGVERDDQLRELTALDCDSGQGHIFGPPLCALDAMALLERRIACTAGEACALI